RAWFSSSTRVATSWSPGPNGPISALAVSGTAVYAGGSFTQVNGNVPRNRAASFSLSTGVVTGWNPDFDGPVDALSVIGSSVQAGGRFTTVGGGDTSRRYLAE